MRESIKFIYGHRLDGALKAAGNLRTPSEGWIRTARKALGMSGTQLAQRLGVSRGAVLAAERAEPNGNVTIAKMQHMAAAMGCRFVYAVVPEKPVEEMIEQRAKEKALKIANKASGHMALEMQSLQDDRFQFEVDNLKQDILKKPSKLWSDD
ncbi:MAG: mobile mystery protein A [Sedimenticola sp.]